LPITGSDRALSGESIRQHSNERNSQVSDTSIWKKSVPLLPKSRILRVEIDTDTADTLPPYDNNWDFRSWMESRDDVSFSSKTEDFKITFMS
jgi:hypothetical protein